MIDPANRYGFIRAVEADLLDELCSTLKSENGCVRFLEVGVAGGGTVTGLVKRCKAIGCPIFAAGVDFEQHLPTPAPLPDYKRFGGDSMDMWEAVKASGLTFNFLLVDACHCKNHSMCDFLNYSPFVEVGGICVFHDTALPTNASEQGDWPQDHSYAGKPNSKLGVRAGLVCMGLLQDYRRDWKFVRELPSDSGLYGMCVFRKVLAI